MAEGISLGFSNLHVLHLKVPPILYTLTVAMIFHVLSWAFTLDANFKFLPLLSEGNRRKKQQKTNCHLYLTLAHGGHLCWHETFY